MPLRRLSLYFVQSPDGLKKLPDGSGKPTDAVPIGPASFVEIRVGRGGAIEVRELESKTVADALREASKGARIGIPIARSRAFGVVFQLAIAARTETADNRA